MRVDDELYAAVPAAHAGSLANLLAQGAKAVCASTPGVPMQAWVFELIDLLYRVDVERASELASPRDLGRRGSAARTEPASIALDAPIWAHDTLTVADAAALSGRSTSYLSRLARERPGFGYRRAGRWHLNREAVAALPWRDGPG